MGFQSNQDYETILWSSDTRLSWGDFQGNVTINSRAAAITASEITYRFSISGTKEKMEVYFKFGTFFIRPSHGIKPNYLTR